MSGLPPDKMATWETYDLDCPWCDADVGDATVTLLDLLYTWERRALARAPRENDGTAAPEALPSVCPTCSRPFIVALQDLRPGRALRLLAVRTPADAAYVCAPRRGEVTA